jgi:purine-binding chemotaxis protein CheW
MINIEVNDAAALQTSAAKGQSDDAQSHLMFWLDQQLYAVNLTSIREVRKVPPLTRVAHSPSYLLGVGSIRGEIVPVIDLKTRFCLPSTSESSIEKLIIITEVNGRRAAVTVDSISEVFSVSKSQISAIPKTAMAIDIKYLKGMVQHDGHILLLVDLEKILEPEELHSFQADAQVDAQVDTQAA